MPRSEPQRSTTRTPSPAVLQGTLAIGVLSVSSAAILIRLVEAPAGAIAFWRLFIATLLLLPGFFHAQRFRQITRESLGSLILSGVFLALHFLTWIQSLSLISVAASTALVSVHPLFVAAYERLFRHQRVPQATYIGGALVFIGLIVMTMSAGAKSHQFLGVIMALLGALFAAGYLLVGQAVRQTLDTTVYAPSVYAVAMVISAGIQLILYHTLGPLSPKILVLYALMAFLPTLGGHTLFNWLLRYLPASTISLAFLGEIAGAALLAWVILGQIPSVPALGGIGTIIIGLVITVRHPIVTQT